MNFDHTAEGLSAYKDELVAYLSDASKDLNGRRQYYDPNVYSVIQLMQLADQYSEWVSEEIRQEKIRQEKAIKEFEQEIDRMILNGASDRETAIKWIKQAYNCDRNGELCYELDLPYNYLETQT